jgi:hypothetical protein
MAMVAAVFQDMAMAEASAAVLATASAALR